MALKNPKLVSKLKFRVSDWLMFSAALVILGISAYVLFDRYDQLPDVIALHIGVDGEPDRFGEKNEILMISGMLSGVVLLLLLMSKYPQYYSYPCHLSENNCVQVYTLGRELILIAALMVSVMLCVILNEFWFAAFYNVSQPFWVLLSVVGVLLLTVAVYLIKITRMKP